ncbi:hypothetical protein [Cellulomonas pakistanensis]|nr:hypothetical protein [Cellulomonas pakistanensis]
MGVHTLAELVGAWGHHVSRLEREARAHPAAGSRERADVWGVYDLIAANYLRDVLEPLMQALGDRERADMRSALDAVDQRFLGFTVPDVHKIVQRIDGGGPRSAWWWNRIPERGPVLDDVAYMLPPGDPDEAG